MEKTGVACEVGSGSPQKEVIKLANYAGGADYGSRKRGF
jgi:hypothetical protein